LIQKKTGLRLSRTTEAGKKLSSLIPVQKHTFSRLVLGTRLMNNVNSSPSVREVSIIVRVQILADLNRVSVLDLDNMFVSAGIHIEKRGSTRLYAFHRSGTKLRSFRYFG